MNFPNWKQPVMPWNNFPASTQTRSVSVSTQTQLVPASTQTRPVSVSTQTQPVSASTQTRPVSVSTQMQSDSASTQMQSDSASTQTQSVSGGRIGIVGSIDKIFDNDRSLYKVINAKDPYTSVTTEDIRDHIFIYPKTSVTLNYKNGKSRDIENNFRDDVIIADTRNGSVERVTIKIMPNNTKLENFDASCRGITFTYYDLLILLLIVFLMYCYFNNLPNIF
jgi:hypothetical protein